MGSLAFVSLVIYALFEVLINLFLQGALWISQQIMNSSVTIFSADENILDSFYNLLPLGLTGSGERVIDLAGIVDGISMALLILIVIASAMKSISAPITGEIAENPAQTIIRALTAIIMKVVIFGSSLFSFDGLLGYIGKVFTIAMAYVGEIMNGFQLDSNFFDRLGEISITLNVPAYVGMLLLTSALVGAVLGASITYIERIITFVASLIIGPIAVVLYANKSTSDVTKTWVQSIFAQLGAILLSLVMWGMFLGQLDIIFQTDSSFFDLSGEDMGNKIFQFAIAIAILSLVRNSEKIFNNIGIRTMPNAESARALMGGIAMTGMAIRSGFSGAAKTQKGIENVLHGGKFTEGFAGRGHVASGGAGASGTVTGNAIYNDKGNMNINNVNQNGDQMRNTGNAIRRGLAVMNQAGLTAPFRGPNSIRSMQNNQSAAMNTMAAAVKDNKAGASIQGMTANYGSETKNFSAAQTANMAISGRPDGTSHFAFVSSTQNANVNASKSGNTSGVASAPAGAAMDASGPDGNSIRVGATKAIDGSDVKGFVGTATHGSQGIDAVRGDFFVPTENGKAELAVGQKIDTGDGVERQITGTKIAIDDFGAYAWEVKPVQEINPMADVNSKLDSLTEKVSSITPGEEAVPSKPEIMYEKDYGAENIEDGNSIDPN